MNEDEFGYYGPSWPIIMLRGLTRAGFGRGVIRKWIEKSWLDHGWDITDARVRGVNYRLRVRENTTDAKILTSSKFYDKEEIFALSQPVTNPGDAAKGGAAVFVDVGANTGYYSLNLARMGYPRVIAIEPNPVTLGALRYNIRVNQLEERIAVAPWCIGNGEEVPFYCSGGLGSASVFAEHHDTTPIRVPSLPLYDILRRENVARVGGMKIDVEGFEDQALFPFFDEAPESLWPNVMVIEDCHRQFWRNDILAKLLGLGYRLQGKTRGNSILRRDEP